MHILHKKALKEVHMPRGLPPPLDNPLRRIHFIQARGEPEGTQIWFNPLISA